MEDLLSSTPSLPLPPPQPNPGVTRAVTEYLDFSILPCFEGAVILKFLSNDYLVFTYLLCR